MNIQQAKEYIKNSITIYLKKDEYGDYRIPIMRQRPIFLLGAPGIGKTAIMEQIASELGIAIVSYSMTHHTRQSALGLPFIKEKEYSGKKVSVSEYTMSEIISSIYETMEESGYKEGILFLDEINCVSETLAPSMLQFLQYKVFGRHRVPDGWVIVTAGNPPEYNKSVREFDLVTLDRLKLLKVEADYPSWKEYAKEKGIHASILNFLDVKKEYFYHIENTPEGKSYVTARGWEDLSDVIYLYEEENLKIDENLICQYLQNDKIVREFSAYYDLYNKYKKDYQLEEILKGQITDGILKKIDKALMDERLSILGMLLAKLSDEMKGVMESTDALMEILPTIKNFKDSENVVEDIDKQIVARKKIIISKEAAGALSLIEKRKHKLILRLYQEMKNAFIIDSVQYKDFYNEKISKLQKKTKIVADKLHNLFVFSDKAFGENSNEMLVLVTELTLGNYTARFISNFGSEDYNKYNNILMVSDRKENLKNDIAKLFN